MSTLPVFPAPPASARPTIKAFPAPATEDTAPTVRSMAAVKEPEKPCGLYMQILEKTCCGKRRNRGSK